MQGEVESSESESESDEEQEPIESENEEQIDEEPDEIDEDKVLCAICQRDEDSNPAGDNEEMVTCTNCESSGVCCARGEARRGEALYCPAVVEPRATPYMQQWLGFTYLLLERSDSESEWHSHGVMRCCRVCSTSLVH
jgi:hypothetical protein